MSRKRSFPFDRVSGKEIRDLSQPGYYSGFSTLEQQNSWDRTTRDVVLKRVSRTLEIRFFNSQEAQLMAAIIDRVVPQDDRSSDRTIPVLPAIDERLHTNSLDGFRYDDMPSDREAYHLGLAAIEDMAQQRFASPFTALSVHRQELILKSLHDGKPDPHHSVWDQMPVHRFWTLLMGDCVKAYYSHPWAWDEIAFGGPAYPRGYMRLENGLPEPWEKDESRYDWNAPADSVSDLDKEDTPPEHGSTHGHGGTH